MAMVVVICRNFTFKEPAHKQAARDDLQGGNEAVIQPNVVTRDSKTGVQTDECVLLADIERPRVVPRGFARVAP